MAGDLNTTLNPSGSGSGDNIFNTSANAFNSGVGNTQAALSNAAVPYTMNQYLNPYQDQVVGNTIGRMQDDRDIMLNDVRGQAAQASAFGGARHGLVEAELMDRSNRNIGETAGALNHQGFNTAAQLGQNRIQQILGGSGQLAGMAGAGQQMGQSALQDQLAAGNQQQSLMQNILSQATGQFDQYANYPQTSLSTALAGVQGNPLAGAGTQTQSFNPGLFNYLQLGAGTFGGGK